MKFVLDERGHLIEREDYRGYSLNCRKENFAVSCMRANLLYGKNQKKKDVKSHHYIISFAPMTGRMGTAKIHVSIPSLSHTT